MCGGANHLVRFYEEEDALLRSVADFSIAELERGGRVVVIATKNHLEGLWKNLRAAHIDIVEARSNGSLIALDATETLARFQRDDRLDQDRFNDVIGGLVEKCRSDGRELSAFGEMVALLSAEGKDDQAVELEGFWNELQRKCQFTLYCAYPLGGFRSAGSSEAFVRICNAHGRVFPTETFAKQTHLNDEQLRATALLQQRAASMEAEVAERRRSEERLRRRESQLSAFVETSSIGLHWVDANGIIVWANAAEIQLLGYSAGEYIGHHITEFHADRDVIDNILACLSRGERMRDREARLRCKDGSIKIVLIDSSVLWEEGRFVHTQCFTRDITEQRRAEAEARHWAIIAESSDDAIFSLDAEHRVTSWNSGAERMFGYARGEVIGEAVKMISDTGRPEEQEVLSRLKRGERVGHYEAVWQRKDGSRLDVSVTTSVLIDSKIQFAGVAKVVRDISDKKRAERALRDAKEEAVRANLDLERRVQERTASLTDLLSQMESFSYAVSHDLRSPLRAMAGYAEVLKSDHSAQLDEEGRQILERIVRSSDRMSRLINDVLAYSRINRDRLELTSVSLSECLRNIVQHAPELQAPQAELIANGELPSVTGNEIFVTQVLTNLLGNSVKFVPVGRKPRIELAARVNGNRVQLSIRDNGIGIPPEHHGRLFGLFERLNVGKRYEGSGMGLAIVRRALERMGGTISVESDGINGSCFTIDLPIANLC